MSMIACSSLCASSDWCGCVSFFFFKQKTAYEMRISDWSSDVCSSDLYHAAELSDFCPGASFAKRIRRQTKTVCTQHHARMKDHAIPYRDEIGRASCRERVCQYV